MGQMSVLYAMSLFNTECVNCFGKKPVHVEKLIIAISTEIGESQCKTFLKTRRIFNYNRFPSFHWVFN